MLSRMINALQSSSERRQYYIIMSVDAAVSLLVGD